MNLKDLQDELAAAAAERGLGPQQNPKNLAMAIAADAGALLTLFQWVSEEQSWRLGGPGEKDAAALALAGVVTHALRLADELGVDVEAVIQARLQPQAPVREMRPAVLPARPPAAPVELPSIAEAPLPEPAPAPVAVPRAEETVVPVDPPAMPAPTPRREKERKPAADATPNWLDGLIPPRAPARGRRAAPESKAAPEPRPTPESKPAPPAHEEDPERAALTALAELPAALAAPEPTGVVHAAAAAPEPGPKWEAVQPAGKERYTDLDPEATKTLVRSLAKRVSAARSDDPLLRDLHDEIETLRRTLYGPNPKRSWLADSLLTIRNMLDEATQVALGNEIRAEEHLAQIERMLAP